MKKVALETIGCRLNQYETEKMAAQLAVHGFERVDLDAEADLYIVNTCTVTGRADASCRGRFPGPGRNKMKPRLVVIGCYVSSDPKLVAALAGVDLIIGNDQKVNLFLSCIRISRIYSMTPIVGKIIRRYRIFINIIGPG